MNILTKLQKRISRKITAVKVIHYRRNLRELNLGSAEAKQALKGLQQDIKLDYYSVIPHKLLKPLNNIDRYLLKDDRGLVARYKGEPIGCILLNFNGKGKLLYPFEKEFYFGRRHAYMHGLYVKKDFREKGIAQLLYAEALKLLKDKCNSVSGYVYAYRSIPNRIIRKFGFEEVEDFVLFKFFRLKLTLRLNVRSTDVKKDL